MNRGAVGEAPALAHGHQLQRVDGADLLPGRGVDEPGGMQGQSLAQEPVPALVAADEADVLAVGLCGGAKAELGRRARTSRLVSSPIGRSTRASASLAEHREDVGLVLPGSARVGAVDGAVGHDAGVVTGRQRVEAEPRGGRAGGRT